MHFSVLIPLVGRRSLKGQKFLTVVEAVSFAWSVPLKARDVIGSLERQQWRHVRTSGDQRIYRSPDGRITVVSGELGEDVRQGTWRAILKQTGIEEPEK